MQSLQLLESQIEGETEFTTYRTVTVFDNLLGGGPIVATGMSLRNPNVYLVHNVPAELSDTAVIDMCRRTIFNTRRNRFFVGELASPHSTEQLILQPMGLEAKSTQQLEICRGQIQRSLANRRGNPDRHNANRDIESFCRQLAEVEVELASR